MQLAGARGDVVSLEAAINCGGPEHEREPECTVGNNNGDSASFTVHFPGVLPKQVSVEVDSKPAPFEKRKGCGTQERTASSTSAKASVATAFRRLPSRICRGGAAYFLREFCGRRSRNTPCAAALR